MDDKVYFGSINDDMVLGALVHSANYIARKKVLFGFLMLSSVLISLIQVRYRSLFYSLPVIIEYEISAFSQVRSVRAIAILGQSTHEPKRSVKTILVWTPIFGKVFSEDYYAFREGQWTFRHFNCEFSECYVTVNRSRLNESDVIIFHGRDTNPNDLPELVRSNQVKIVYNLESPDTFNPKWYKKQIFFNWTMDYRNEADVQVKYGETYRGDKNYSLETTINKWNYKEDRALWMVSNCKTPSRREAYVTALKKYYPVDIYGKCGKLKCSPPQSESCYRELVGRYKFYLSFENSICKDYVTEKFYNALMYDIVPVVFGGANYDEVAPPGSFINALNFPNPKDLASYMWLVGNNSNSYASFFTWKKHYSVHLFPWMCNLCKRLHEPLRSQSYDNLYSNWTGAAKCKKWNKTHGFVERSIRGRYENYR